MKSYFYEDNSSHSSKPDFMSKHRLAEEFCCSVDYIDNLIKKGVLVEEVNLLNEYALLDYIDNLIKKGVLVEEVHFFRDRRFIRFYYPQVRRDLAPKHSEV